MCLHAKFASTLSTKTTEEEPCDQPTSSSWYNATWHTGGNALNCCSRIHNDKNGWIGGFADLVHAVGAETIARYAHSFRQNWQQLQPPTWGLERIMFCVGNKTDLSLYLHLARGQICWVWQNMCTPLQCLNLMHWDTFQTSTTLEKIIYHTKKLSVNKREAAFD